MTTAAASGARAARPFAIFLAGLTISKLGDALHTFALPWIAYDLTGSAVVMSTLFATEIVPVLLFGGVAGVLVDRVDRRKLMIATDLLRAVLVAAIPLLGAAGWLQVWHLYLVAFALSVLSLAFDVATTVAIPELAGRDLVQANASHQLIMQLVTMAGPALAGIIIAALTSYGAMWLNAFSFGGTLVALLLLPPFRQCGGATASSVIAGMVEGFRWLWDHAVIRALSLQAMIGNFGFGMVNAVLMFYLRDVLGLSPQVSGLNYAMLGVGGIAGSLVIVPLARRFRRSQLYPALLLFGMTGLLVRAAIRTWWAPGLGFGMVSACNVAWVVLSTSVRQEQIPGELMGRVLSFTRVLSTAAMPIGAVLGGLIVERFDPALVFLIGAGTKLVETGIARFSAMRTL
ncbi:MFS transporter [Symbiobacterium terraclitae]|uniref:MFS transporter n=1 Tax=Symbiobacterium terraclitae TaxID=557451 RepID=UPI0035B500B5